MTGGCWVIDKDGNQIPARRPMKGSKGPRKLEAGKIGADGKFVKNADAQKAMTAAFAAQTKAKAKAADTKTDTAADAATT